MKQLTLIVQNVICLVIGIVVGLLSIWLSYHVGLKISELSGQMAVHNGMLQDSTSDFNFRSLACYTSAATASAVISNIGGLIAGVLVSFGCSIISVKNFYREVTRTWIDFFLTIFVIGVVAFSEVFAAIFLHNFLRSSGSMATIAILAALLTFGGTIMHLYETRSNNDGTA